MPGFGAVVALLGIAGAAAGFASERRRRKRNLLQTDFRSVLGLESGAFRRDSLERRVIIDAAALSFGVVAACLILYGFAAAVWALPNPPIYTVGGPLGGIFGVACAAVGRSRGRQC